MRAIVSVFATVAVLAAVGCGGGPTYDAGRLRGCLDRTTEVVDGDSTGQVEVTSQPWYKIEDNGVSYRRRAQLFETYDFTVEHAPAVEQPDIRTYGSAFRAWNGAGDKPAEQNLWETDRRGPPVGVIVWSGERGHEAAERAAERATPARLWRDLPRSFEPNGGGEPVVMEDGAPYRDGRGGPDPEPPADVKLKPLTADGLVAQVKRAGGPQSERRGNVLITSWGKRRPAQQRRLDECLTEAER